MNRPLTTLYIDMNSFFSSVEQHFNPELRGRPVGITAVEGSTAGALVAASYEAKAYGIKTGTLVSDAKRLCPDIILLPSRHKLYVRMNLRIASVLDEICELERVRSVDEFQLRLPAPTENVSEAYALVQRLKEAVYGQIGASLRFSAGLGSNHLLAKIAGKLEKPDGCKHLWARNMPDAVAHLKPDDLPGISTGTMRKLAASGITSISQLYHMDPRHARAVWGSIEGERFVRALQGEQVELPKTERGGYGSSKVLSPDFRAPKEAYLVGRWLVEKATGRLRGDGRVASEFSLSMRFLDGSSWGRSIRCEASQATHDMLAHHKALWRLAWPSIRGRKLASISVNLSKVGMIEDRTGDLLRPLKPAERAKAEIVSAALDQINMRFGPDTISVGVNRPHYGFFERG